MHDVTRHSEHKRSAEITRRRRRKRRIEGGEGGRGRQGETSRDIGGLSREDRYQIAARNLRQNAGKTTCTDAVASRCIAPASAAHVAAYGLGSSAGKPEEVSSRLRSRAHVRSRPQNRTLSRDARSAALLYVARHVQRKAGQILPKARPGRAAHGKSALAHAHPSTPRRADPAEKEAAALRVESGQRCIDRQANRSQLLALHSHGRVGVSNKLSADNLDEPRPPPPTTAARRSAAIRSQSPAQQLLQNGQPNETELRARGDSCAIFRLCRKSGCV